MMRRKGGYVHPGEILHFLWRYAFLLLIPFIRQFFAAQGPLWQRLAATATNLLLTFLVAAVAAARWHAIRFAVYQNTVRYDKGLLRRCHTRLPLRAVENMTQRSSPLAFICGAVWVELETSSSRRRKADIEVLLSYRKAEGIFALLGGERRREELV